VSAALAMEGGASRRSEGSAFGWGPGRVRRGDPARWVQNYIEVGTHHVSAEVQVERNASWAAAERVRPARIFHACARSRNQRDCQEELRFVNQEAKSNSCEAELIRSQSEKRGQ